jgi:thymidylate kinase
VLGLRGIEGSTEALAECIVQSVATWSESLFNGKYLTVFLAAPFEILKERLESRIGRSLTSLERSDLIRQVHAYDELSSKASSWSTVCLDARRAPHELLDDLEARLAT